MFRSKADESYPLNPQKGPIDAYLDIDTIIKIALNAGVDAIHPGYGFLSENPEFVDACEQNGITFIGPSSDIMRAMGDKISSKQIAIAADVPIIPGVDHAMKSYEEAAKIADMVGYPIMLKASNGGGGRGMRIVNDPADLEKEFNEARNESKKAFGDDIDSLAVKTAQANALENGFDESKFKAVQGNLSDKVTGKYNVIVANIVADIIMEFNKEVGKYLDDGGVYITGGIIESREDEVLLSFAQNSFEVIERFEEKGWLVFVLKKA